MICSMRKRGVDSGIKGWFVLFIIMGQNSSFHLSITDVIKQWAPISKDSPIFINRTTRQHLQRFIVQIPLPELLREVTIYNARIQAVYPFVCRVAYFNQVPSDDEQLGFRSFAVYTDHLMPIREADWSLLRFVQALEGMLTLIGYYGYFRLVEGMMRMNQKGQTKVWISDSPANNHRDAVLTTEEQALAAFTGLAARKNYQVANLLIGCVSLEDALEKLTKPRRKQSSPFQNVTHYTNQEREGGHKDYKNVFHEIKEETRPIEPSLKIPGSALFSGARKEEFKPCSYGGKPQNALSGRTTSQYKKAKPTGTQFFLKQRPGSKNIGETSFDNFSKAHKKTGCFEPTPHFQTATNFTNFHIPSPTNKQQAKPHTFTPDITIINNNVSHVVNNITHNHSAWANLRNARTPQFAAANNESRKQSVSPIGRQGKNKVSAPKFIQERKHQGQGKHNIKSFYASNSEKSSGIIITTPKSVFANRDPQSFNSTHTSNNTNTQESFKTAEMDWNIPPQSQKQRKPQKLYTFCQNIIGKSPPKPFSTSFSPHSHTPLTPPAHSIPQSHTTSFFKKPSRTLTTEFNEPPIKMPSSFMPASNKSFTLDRPDRSMTFETDSFIQSNKPLKEKITISQAIPEEVAESLPTSKSIPITNPATSGKSIEQNNLKRQLKLQFSNLLGEPKLQRKQESGKQTPPQSNLKQKIQQKKMAFAELKKQALAVLTDIL